MGQKDGRISRVIRRMMTVAFVVFAVLLTLQAGKTAGMGRDGREVKEWIFSQAERGLSLLWGQSYPAVGWEDNSRGIAGKETPGAVLLRLAFEWSPFYREPKSQEAVKLSYEEADPAFFGFLEQGKFYEEHSFLLYDGDEETGEDGDGYYLANGSGGPQAMAGGDGGTETKPQGAGDGGGTGPGGTASETALGTASKTAGGDSNAANGAGQFTASQQGLAAKEDLGTYSIRSALPVTGTTYRKEQLADFDFLMKHFYSVHASTTAGRDLLRADQFLSYDFTLEGGNEKPQILIYHTHSQEEFADYGPDRPDATVVGLGNYLTELLQAKGYFVIHDTSVYDYRNGKLDRNKAYTYALEGITGILQKNPSIQVVIDLHRDGVNEKLHMVNQVNGKPTAPIMFFNGVSQTPDGPIEYLQNPYREDNLAFSFQMHLNAAAYFPGLTRKIYIKGLRYNLHLRARSALIEAGAQTNTYQEVLNAMEPLAELLDMVLQGN